MKRGEKKAAEALYKELSGKVFGFCRTRVSSRQTAEDLSQEIFIKLVERIETFDEKKGNFVVWFWRLARNTVIDHYREKKMASFADIAEEALEGITDSDSERPSGHNDRLDIKMEHERLRAFVSSLTEAEQEVFEARYVADLSYKEMAELLDKSEGALRVEITRLKKKIKAGFK